MNEIVAIVVCAALFAAFGWLQRGQAAPRGCGACPRRDADGNPMPCKPGECSHDRS
jgi:hypothetical protein